MQCDTRKGTCWNFISYLHKWDSYYSQLLETHEVVTFVDNTKAMISFKPGPAMNEYINKYFKLLQYILS